MVPGDTIGDLLGEGRTGDEPDGGTAPTFIAFLGVPVHSGSKARKKGKNLDFSNQYFRAVFLSVDLRKLQSSQW